MFYRKKGMPKEGEIVLCKVTKIFHSSVFANLVEYGDYSSGMIHISEIAPGRIRNLRDYVKVGKQIVCVILKINRERGHIDLSLRRVSSNQMRQKLDEIKQELKAEQVIKKLASQTKLKNNVLYKKIADKVLDLEEYDYIFEAFKEVVKDEISLEELGIEKEISDKLSRGIKERFKEPIANFKGEIFLQTYVDNGVEKIKSILEKVQKCREDIDIKYLGAGKYSFSFKDKEIANAEADLQKIEKVVAKFSDNKISKSGFSREKAQMED